MKSRHRRREIFRQELPFGARDDDKKPGEHQQKAAIYSGIKFMRINGTRQKKQRAANERCFGNWNSCKKTGDDPQGHEYPLGELQRMSARAQLFRPDDKPG